MAKAILCSLFSLIISNIASAQSPIEEDALRKHLGIIASDEFEGRNTGSLGQLKAARYISNIFDESGLEKPVDLKYQKSYFQDIPLQITKLDNVHLSSGKRFLPYGSDFFALSLYYPDTAELEVVFAGYGIDAKEYSDYDGLDIKGKIALIIWGEPKTSDGKFLLTGEEKNSAWGTRYGIYKKVKAARSLGAQDVLVLMPDMESFETRKSQVTRYSGKGSYLLPNEQEFSGKKTKYGSMYTHPYALEALLGMKKGSINKKLTSYVGGGKKFRIESFKIRLHTSFSFQDVATSNVLGVLPGTDLKEQYLVITSHYDHLGKKGDDIYNGADDDGSGTAALVTLAEALSKDAKEGKPTKRSILFMAFTGEEKGLLGSKYYCDQDPVIPLEKIVTNLNIDMIGRRDGDHERDSNYVYLIGSDMLSTKVHELSEEANKECCNVEFDYQFNNFQDPNNFYKRSDHYNFAKNDIPVIFYFNGSHEDYHKPTDTVDKIEFGLYRNRAEVIYYTVRKLANYEGVIEADKSFDEPEK